MKRFLLAIASGLLFALSWPTYGFVLVLFFAFIPLLYIEYDIRLNSRRLNNLKILSYSYLTFFIWNFFTTSWLRFADGFGASFAILVNSLLMSLVFLAFHLAAKRTSKLRAQIFFISLWISFEFLHLHWEFSWPWLNLGNAFSASHTWIQWYEYTGTFGGSLWVLVVNVLTFNVILKRFKMRNISILKRLLIPSIIIIVPIAISYVMYVSDSIEGKTAKVVIIQPNIDPYDTKYNLPNSDVSDLILELADEKVTNETDFIIAPETVFAQGVYVNQFETALFKYKLDKYVEDHPNINVITGVSFVEIIKDQKKLTSQSNFLRDSVWFNDYNSAVLINNTGKKQVYHKSKLVVGVENFPYQSFLKPILGDIMIDLGGTVAMKSTQSNRDVLNSSNGKFRAAPIICYESVYGEFVTGFVRNGANFLTIITNDAWWNETQGHKQHLSYARLRAIETRRSIARSANTGISAIINPKGDIINALKYGKQGAIDGNIKANDKLTFYVLAGDYIARISVFVMLLLGLIIFFRKPRAKI